MSLRQAAKQHSRQRKGPLLDNANASSFLGRHQFIIYRLFSLSGIFPVGGYVIVHLLTNATVLDSPATFQGKVDTIHSLGILLPLVEWVFIFIPILFHAIVGWMIVSGMVANVGSYPYMTNFRYTMQRITGVIAFFFILWHVWQMHYLGASFGGGKFDAHHASSSAAGALQSAVVVAGYIVGTLAVVYHLANGIWTFGITWGIWTSERAMRGAGYVCLAFGLLLAGVGMSALAGMKSVDIPAAIETEKRMEEYRKLSRGE
jgi:succinate dehydrogenase / fumarate reductase, cytochrome b subunit